jgi:predicted permease
MRNLKHAFRTLFRTPVVTLVAVLSLALGIGANAAIFSLLYQALLRPLPVPEPGRLVNLTAPGPNPGMVSCNEAGDCQEVWSYPMFKDLERSQTVLAGLAAHRAFESLVSFRGEPVIGQLMMVSGSYFGTLGLRPALGRLIGPDDETIGGHPVAVLSYGFWSGRLGADPKVLGSNVVVDGRPLEVVGVAPRGFEGTTLGIRPTVFAPITLGGARAGLEDRRSSWLYLFGRLKPGVTREQAGAALNALYRPILNEVEAPLQTGLSDEAMARFRSKEIRVEPGLRGQSSVHRQTRTPLLLLFGLTGIVVLIACANIANLLLARGATRAREWAVRLALGAGRRQLVAQLLAESVLLAGMGGAAGVLVAWGALRAIAGMLPSQTMAGLSFELQLPALGFCAGVALATGLGFGMFPALHSTRTDLIRGIRGGAGQITGTRGAARVRASLVTLQIALATALLSGAGLFVRSLINVSRVDLGLHADHVVTFGIVPARVGYTPAQARPLFERVEQALSGMPGVTGVTSTVVPLLAGENWSTPVDVEGYQPGPDTDKNSRYNEVGPGYFSTLGIPLVAGREFTPADGAGTGRVAVVNQAFVQRFHLGRDAVGRFLSIAGPDSLNIQIVGVAENTKYSEVKQQAPALFYLPWKQESWVGFLIFYVRTSGEPESLIQAIPGVIKRIDPAVPVENLKTLPRQIRENVFFDRAISFLSAAFALLATLLAAIGLYGVLAYTVAQRTREIGVRMMVLRQTARVVAVGLAAGMAAAAGLGRAAGSLLFGLPGYDPAVFTLAAGVLVLVAFGAAYLPALRASRVHPMQALRSD